MNEDVTEAIKKKPSVVSFLTTKIDRERETEEWGRARERKYKENIKLKVFFFLKTFDEKLEVGLIRKLFSTKHHFIV